MMVTEGRTANRRGGRSRPGYVSLVRLAGCDSLVCIQISWTKRLALIVGPDPLDLFLAGDRVSNLVRDFVVPLRRRVQALMTFIDGAARSVPS